MVKEKKWYESWTIWINVIVLIIASAGVFLQSITGGDLPLEPGPKFVAIVMSLINILLRFMTSSSIERR